MRRFDIDIERIGWRMHVYVGVHCLDAGEILSRLEGMGCSSSELARAREALTACRYNTGMTYSFLASGESVLVVGLTSSSREFFNSVTHEIMHQAVHISSRLGLDLEGEDPCYLAGEIAGKMYSRVSDLLCGHCHPGRTYPPIGPYRPSCNCH